MNSLHSPYCTTHFIALLLVQQTTPQYKFEITTMSEALKILNNIRTLRAQARECTLETLEEMLEKLEVVVNERREEENAAAAKLKSIRVSCNNTVKC